MRIIGHKQNLDLSYIACIEFADGTVFPLPALVSHYAYCFRTYNVHPNILRANNPHDREIMNVAGLTDNMIDNFRTLPALKRHVLKDKRNVSDILDGNCQIIMARNPIFRARLGFTNLATKVKCAFYDVETNQVLTKLTYMHSMGIMRFARDIAEEADGLKLTADIIIVGNGKEWRTS